MSKREIAKIARELRKIKAQLKKGSVITELESFDYEDPKLHEIVITTVGHSAKWTDEREPGFKRIQNMYDTSRARRLWSKDGVSLSWDGIMLQMNDNGFYSYFTA